MPSNQMSSNPVGSQETEMAGLNPNYGQGPPPTEATRQRYKFNSTAPPRLRAKPFPWKVHLDSNLVFDTNSMNILSIFTLNVKIVFKCCENSRVRLRCSCLQLALSSSCGGLQSSTTSALPKLVL